MAQHFETHDGAGDDDKGKKLYIRMQLSKDIPGVTQEKLKHLLFCIHKVDPLG